MRRRSNRLLRSLIFSGAVFSAPFLLAQDTEPVFSSDVRLVPLNVSVLDKSGHHVLNLPQSAFTVYENEQPQTIKLFKREDVPVSLGLVIDNSGSMRERRSSVEAAAVALVKDSNPQDETFVVNFNDEAYLDAEFTSDIKQLEAGLARIDARGGTAMRDAIRMSVEHLREKSKRNKKVILVVTDGNDNSSNYGLNELVRLAQQNDVLIYTIGILATEDKAEAKKAKRALDLLVEQTGGEAFYPKEVTEVELIAHQVAHDIRNQYSIAYSPTNTAQDGTFRKIRVMVKAAGNPVVRTRAGYYATKPK
jgi:VWFA-related protein